MSRVSGKSIETQRINVYVDKIRVDVNRRYQEMIRKMFNREDIGFRGEIYSHEYERKFHTERSVAKVEPDPKQPQKFRLNIDGLDIYDWFCQKQKEFLHSIGVKPQERQEKKGLKI